MRADRDKKITIKGKGIDADGQNEYGEPNPADYKDVATNVWASISPVFGKEYWQAEQVQSKTTTRIELDFIAGIDRSMMVFYGERTFEILSVIDIKEMHRTLQLMCKELGP
jgi:SPP1 family predicted phage head-tail adaptor